MFFSARSRNRSLLFFKLQTFIPTERHAKPSLIARLSHSGLHDF